MTDTYTVTGTLIDGRTILLDEELPLPSGTRVRITILNITCENPSTEAELQDSVPNMNHTPDE